MSKKLSPVTIFIVIIGCVEMTYASKFGAMLGWGNYSADGDGGPGVALSSYFDVDISKSVSFSPSVKYWIGGDNSVCSSDLALGVGLKGTLKAGTIATFLGMEPGLHILSDSESSVCFGLNCFGGMGILLSDYLSVPLHFSYGMIFEENSTVHRLTFQVGINIGS